MKPGDYVYDWELGRWGLILDQLPCDSYVLLYEDGEQGEAFENALGVDQREVERESTAVSAARGRPYPIIPVEGSAPTRGPGPPCRDS